MAIQFDPANGRILSKDGSLSSECCCKCIEKCPSACFKASPYPCGGQNGQSTSRPYTLGGFSLNCFAFMNGSGTMVRNPFVGPTHDCEWQVTISNGFASGFITLECIDGEWYAFVGVPTGDDRFPGCVGAAVTCEVYKCANGDTDCGTGIYFPVCGSGPPAPTPGGPLTLIIGDPIL